MRHPRSLGVALLIVLAAMASTTASQAPEGDARDAALTWVALVDAGAYADSWTATAQAFRRAVTQEQRKASAVETMTMVREADGAWRVVGYFVR